MTYTTEERLDKRRLIGDPPNRRAVREFHSYTTESGETLTPEQAPFFLPANAQPDEFHPELPGYRATSWPDAVQRPGTNNHVDMTVYYEPDPEIEFGAGAAWIQTVDHGGAYLLSWRSSPATSFALAAGNYQFPGRTGDADDIGGFPLDSKGTPNTFIITRSVIQVTQRLNRPLDAVYNQLVNHRNDRDFLGVPAGKLLFLGARSYQSVASQVATVVFRFVTDEWFHMRQIPARNIHGGPKLNSSAAIVSQGQTFDKGTVAFPVYWYQPYPQIGKMERLGLPTGDPDPRISSGASLT